MKRLIIFSMILTAGVSLASINRPYIDGEGTNALWHMDSIRINKYVDDDDSVVTGRDADLILVPNPVDTEGGPTLTDPETAGIGYPADQSDFANCIYLNGIDNHISIANSNLTINPADLRIEGWFKADAAIDRQILLDRWGQIVVFADSDQINIYAWDGTGSADTGINAGYSVSGADPTEWTHFAVTVVGESLEVYINDVLSANATLSGGLSDTTNKTVTYIGMRYNAENYYGGYIDEFRISEASVPAPMPEWAVPYSDEAATNSALWHFDNLADPNVTGVSYELLPDDDSDNPGRDADLYLYGDGDRVNVGESGGPTLVNPDSEGIGYPYDNPDFGKSAYFDDPVLVEADDFRINHSSLDVDTSNIAVECWFKLDEALLDGYTPSSNEAYYLFDRWGEIIIKVVQNSAGEFLIEALPWNEDGSYYYLNTNWGYDVSGWHHVRFENYQGESKLLVDGVEVESWSMGTTHLGTLTKDATYIGRRYNGEYFWGYIDEMKISQAVYDVDCGAWGYLPGDINQDCVVDGADLKIMAEEWLNTTDPSNPLAIEGEIIQYETYNIPASGSPPTIDGTISAGEWDDAASFFMGMPELVTSPNIGSQKYEVPDSHSDFSGDWYYKWDNEYLYVGVKVYDDVLLFDSGYPDDHIVLALDIEAGQGNVVLYDMYRDYFGDAKISINTTIPSTFTPDNAVYESAVQTDGWSFEAALRWTDFGGYTPTEGDNHGTAVLMCDQDDSLGSTRDTFLMDAGEGDTDVMENPELYKLSTLTSGFVCGDNGYLLSDINTDCYTELVDFSAIGNTWLECSDPQGEGCVDSR